MNGGIALVIADLGGGGAQQVMTQLANRLAADGEAVTAILLAGPDEPDFFTLSPAVRQVRIDVLHESRGALGKLLWTARRVRLLRGALRRSGAATAVSFIAPTNVLTVMAARGLGLRVVVCERNDPSRQSFGRAWDRLRVWAYRQADLVTANSRAAVETLARLCPAEKIAYAPNLLRRPETAAAEAERERVFLTVGRLHPQKAQDALIRAFAQATVPDWRLEIIGEGPERLRLEGLVRELDLGGSVSLPGRVADPFAAYARCGVFVLPSLYEGAPNVLLEAMATGAPALVSDAVEAMEGLIREDETGCWAPAGDVDALAAKMAKLAADPNLRRRIGGAGQRAVLEEYGEAPYAEWRRLLGLTPAAGAASNAAS